MATPEERLRQRERVAITTTTAGAVPAHDVAWSGVWAGALVAMAVLVVLTSLGVAIGVSVLDVNPASANNGQGWTIGAGLWAFCSFLVAMFVGGMVSTRGDYGFSQPLAAVHGTLVWVLSLVAIAAFGFVRLATLGPTVGTATGAMVQPAATIAGWVSFVVIVVSLALAIAGATAGAARRPAV
jgi:hypothetical protein